jgi:hypothetical protein
MFLTSSPALSTPSTAIKRKASSFDDDFDDAENVDPVIFLSPKRSKAIDGTSKDSAVKPVNFFLTKAPQPASEDLSPLKASSAPRRPILQARSPLPKLSTASISKSSPLNAPAGRSPTRKRVGILNRRRTASPFTRIEPPKFGAAAGGASSGLGFSIDAALSGTIPSYAARQRREQKSTRSEVVPEPESTKASWFFDIHEDTADELATNLMEHSTCTLDISSDEESAARMRDERGKENVPPPDDISQTRTLLSESSASSSADPKARSRASHRRELDDTAIDIDRCPLGDLRAEEFYAEGCDEKSVVIVDGPEEEYEEYAEEQEHQHNPEQVSPSVLAAAGLHHSMTFDFCVEQPKAEETGKNASDELVDQLMQKSDWDVAPKAAVLEPLEKAEEGFQVWESGSAKGDE